MNTNMKTIAMALSAAGLVLAAQAREPLVVTLTFDDSTADHVIAAKSLEKRGWTGSFNIITGWIGREGRNGSRKGAELTWDEVRAIKKAGHQVNSHTANHVRLKKLAEDGKLDVIRKEFADSKAAIEKETGVAPKYLCHPFVQTTPEVDKLIVEAGMLPMTDLRINFGGEDNDPGTETDLGHKLDKWYADGIKARDLMFHGIDKDVGVWRPFKSLADWEKTLDMLKEREQKGLVKVLNYDDFYAYAKKIGAAPAVVMK